MELSFFFVNPLPARMFLTVAIHLILCELVSELLSCLISISETAELTNFVLTIFKYFKF